MLSYGLDGNDINVTINISIYYKSYGSGQVWKKMKKKLNIYYCIINEGFSHRHLFHSKNICPPPLPYFKVNIYPLPLPHFASICFAYLWSFRWPNYIVTLPRYFSFRLPHLNINIGPPSDELDKNIQRKSHFLFFSHWNGYSHFRSVLNWFRN